MRVTLGVPLKLSEIAACVGGIMQTDDRVIRGAVSDSRQFREGDLFFALPGNLQSGELFVPDVIARGGAAISCEGHEGTVLVSDVKAALLGTAKLYLSKLKRPRLTAAVTGSVGKTTTKEMLAKLVGGSPFKTEGNYNSTVGVPLSILSAPESTEVMILECGMNHAGELKELSRLCAPDIAVITNIGTAHIGNFGSREMLAKAKCEITEGQPKDAPVLVPYGEPLLDGLAGKTTFSIRDERADFSLIPLAEGGGETQVCVRYLGEEYGTTEVALCGRAALECLAAAALCAI